MKKILILSFLGLVYFTSLTAQIDTMATLVVSDNQEAELAYNKGVENYKLKNFDKSIENFTNAIKRKSNFYQAYYNRGNIKKELAKYKEALEDFNVV